MVKKASGIVLVSLALILLAAPAIGDRRETIVTVDQDGRPTSETWIRETEQGDRRTEDIKIFAPPPAPEPALNDPPPERGWDDVSPQR
jgi:hypothetical protein